MKFIQRPSTSYKESGGFFLVLNNQLLNLMKGSTIYKKRGESTCFQE